MSSAKTYRFGPNRIPDKLVYQEMEAQLREEELSRCKPHEGLKLIRKEHKRSQAEMATLLDVSRRSYQDFESGKRAIPSDVLLRLYGHFNCDLHKLFTGASVPVSRKDRASFVTAALDAVFALLKRFGEQGITERELRHYAIMTAELTDPGEDPELLWLLELAGRDRAGLPRFGFGDEEGDGGEG
ncbi:helix-turn-helix transcriptional regulator [Pseudogemmobacter humi]|uniref:Helix-turn-helix protein n=1 Tax=Pseudogemmobacter humi TaxID=2483812 RepID=A0A3P5XIP6_9RHOB|nr:helix-turn-helix transcriptional regulator [Pseudogemmobacter humi]VDC28601.1 helix-turn-helix protein [Pseudogemmobacter humi]